MDPIVEVAEGKLKGCTGTSLDGDNFYRFLGVPYAKPPLGELRFKAPLPAEPWEGIRDATNEGDSCYHRNFLTHVIEGSEDCLLLNIYTRKLPSPSTKPFPVMVWFHGGAFITGSNKTDVHGPEYLMNEDVVLVVINYRGGILGFLSLKDTSLEVPGNAGLKDQAMALKWVQKNISNFNGDPNNVTIFGVSAGAASVHYQILSPTTRGLFHKAILQSGTGLCPWARSDDNVMNIMRLLGKEAKDEREILTILRNTSLEELNAALEALIAEKKTTLRVVGPVIEKPNETAFITKPPIDILISGEYNKVPIMIGYMADEGMILEFQKNMDIEAGRKVSDDPPDLEDMIPAEMNVEKRSETSKLIVKKLADTYFTGENLANPLLIVNDCFFIAGIYATIKNTLQTCPYPIYLYKMTLDAELNFLKRMGKLDHLKGTCHGDEVSYLFKHPILCLNEKDSIEELTVRRFVRMWTNFAKFGNPTPNEKDVGVIWKPVDKECFYYLDIGEKLILGKNPDYERMPIWKEIYQLSPNTELYL